MKSTMEPKSFDEVLDIVKNILSTTPSVVQDDSPILPTGIAPLPSWATSLPEGSAPISKKIEKLTANILPYLNASSLSARYYGFITGGVTPAALVGDILASVYDQNLQVHLPQETIATDVEVVALNMLVDLLMLPRPEWSIGTAGNGGGIFTTGATASNVLGLALGREYVLSEAAKRATGEAMSVGEHGILAVSRAAQIDHVKVLSTMPHSSVAKAASLVGLGRSSYVLINKKNTALAIDIEALRNLAAKAEAERTAYILVVSAGEVNTGHFASDSIEMLREVRDICDKYGIWMHVDGAFGLYGRLLMNHPRARDYEQIINGVRGLELADSITADAHKLLNVPYDCGVFFTRHKSLSEATCMNDNAAYLKSDVQECQIQSPLNIGIENSRRFRALPVYLTLSVYGREGYCDMLCRKIALARRLASWMWDHENYDLLPQEKSKDIAISKTFVVVLFRAKDVAANRDLVRQIKDSGEMYVSGTSWEGMPAARIAVSNWRTDEQADAEVVQQILDNLR